MLKKCPKCGKSAAEMDYFCTKCGVELVKDDNRCSEMKRPDCRVRTYADDDIYCASCGALTTYAKFKLNKE